MHKMSDSSPFKFSIYQLFTTFIIRYNRYINDSLKKIIYVNDKIVHWQA